MLWLLRGRAGRFARALVGAGVLCAPHAMVAAQKSPHLARPLEYTGRTLAGDSIRIGPGEAVTLVNVFATWCRSCKTELADLDALAREYGPRGVRVVAVSVDQSSTDRVKRFMDARHVGFVVVHDSSATVMKVFHTVGVPESYLIDAEGRIAWHRSGEIKQVLPALRSVLHTLLSAAR